jgi:hypothetical protein
MIKMDINSWTCENHDLCYDCEKCKDWYPKNLSTDEEKSYALLIKMAKDLNIEMNKTFWLLANDNWRKIIMESDN